MSGELNSTYVHVPRFEAGSVESVEHLNDEGYVVIANVLDSEQTAEALDLTWQFLEDLGTGIDRNDPSTWSDDRWPIAVHGGIIPSQGIGQSAAQWFIRSAPGVKQAFASVWDDDDLLVSFDGMALWRPSSIEPEWQTNRGGSWLHIDQHPVGRPGFQCVQGLVNLIATSPEVGGNILIPGSHLLHDSIADRYPERLGRIHPSIDHFRYPSDDPLLTNTPPIMAHLDAGDLLLWDSRTIHCSSPGTTPDAGGPSLQRAVSLICMMPKARSNDGVIERRRQAVADRTSTTNWSDVWVNADKFPNVLAADTDRYQLPPVPELTEYQQSLVG